MKILKNTTTRENKEEISSKNDGNSEYPVSKKLTTEERRRQIFNKANRRMLNTISTDIPKTGSENSEPLQQSEKPPIPEGITLGQLIPRKSNILKNSVKPQKTAAFVTIVPFLKKNQDGVKIQVPETMDQLLEKGGNRLGLNSGKNTTLAVKVRMMATKKEVLDISELQDGDVIYLMTPTDEKRVKPYLNQ